MSTLIRKNAAFMAALLLAGSAAWAQQPQPAQPPALPRGDGQLYSLGPFERLEVAGSATVKLVQGDKDEVYIVGGSELQRSVEVSLNGDRLMIKPTGSWKFWNNTRLQIDVEMRHVGQLILSGATDLHAPGLIKAEELKISISGAGLARFDELACDQLGFSISGAGEGQLRGKVRKLSLNVSGKGKLQAEELQANLAHVSISGIGSAALWVLDDLKVGVSGIGSVDYWGKPAVKRSSAGFSSVTARGEKRPAQ
ncbi:head GIN domain-containing protein [Pelomonas sp. SE-A7]|uniref:head GIN domain-containing protein n=1 Tax=Pelomonas sp. SE-A7 TaxID=3054953 RepID=UPI00259CA00B|nr:head GIN domain-containing protein [Pelomonas sp. SE-A7]MDM4767034.1 head GIN domain-containing protein [Pelomonas sp. SE-A7]